MSLAISSAPASVSARGPNDQDDPGGCHGHFTRAQKVIPGGVNSPARSMKFVNCTPPFMTRAQGSRIYDERGGEYIDYVMSWGSAVAGHAHLGVIEAVSAAARRGLSFGAPTVAETELCELILSYFDHMDQLRLVCSGTEACMSGIRLARAYHEHRALSSGGDSGGGNVRRKIIKFHGHYHGHSDALLVKAGSGAATCGYPDSLGVTPGSAQDTLTAEFNDLDSLQRVLSGCGDEISCVILEVVMGNGGFILPSASFINALSELRERYGFLIIADEVMTGFRVGLHGAAGHYSLRPDITILGKVIGGGLPLAAYGARDEIMAQVAPRGGMYQAGTLAGNPVAVASGLATLKALLTPGVFDEMARRTEKLCLGMKDIAQELGLAFQSSSLGGMWGYYFLPQLPRRYADVAQMNPKFYRRFFRTMLRGGIYLPPSPYESCFLSIAHTDQDVSRTLDVFEKTLVSLKKQERGCFLS